MLLHVQFVRQTLATVTLLKLLHTSEKMCKSMPWVSPLVGKRDKTKDVSVSVSCGYVGVSIIRCNALLLSIVLFILLCCQPLSHLSAL